VALPPGDRLRILGALFLARRPSRRWGAIAVLILAGWITQVSFALMEGKGLDGLQDRMVSTGHAGFAREALRTDDYLEVARHYESLIAGHRLSGLCSTKPPGQLLVYLLTLRASAILDLVATGIGRFTRLTIFASLTWPLMTYLVCLVMPPMGVQLGCRRRGLGGDPLRHRSERDPGHAAPRSVPLPSSRGVPRPALPPRRAPARGWSAALAGVTLYLGLFVTFSLLPSSS